MNKNKLDRSKYKIKNVGEEILLVGSWHLLSACLEEASADILHWTDSHATCQTGHATWQRHAALPRTQAGKLGSMSDSCFTLSGACFSEKADAVTGHWSVAQ